MHTDFFPIFYWFLGLKLVHLHTHTPGQLANNPIDHSVGLVFNLLGKKVSLIETSAASGVLNCDIHWVLIPGPLLLPSLRLCVLLPQHCATNGLTTAMQLHSQLLSLLPAVTSVLINVWRNFLEGHQVATACPQCSSKLHLRVSLTVLADRKPWARPLKLL